MSRKRALAVLTAASCAAALLAGCERSATAPLGVAASLAPTGSVTSLADGPALASGLLDPEGGILEVSERPGYPLRSTLTVPAGTLGGPAYFEVAQQVSGEPLTLRVSGRSAEQLQAAAAQSLTDDPIVLTIRNVGGEAPDITVVFSPPDGSEPVLARASLHAGQSTSLGFRRGRSKYSVIYF